MAAAEMTTKPNATPLFGGEDLQASVGHGEADVDRGDHDQAEGVDGRAV